MTRTYTWSISIGGVTIPNELIKAAGTIDYGKATRFNGFTAPRAVFELYNESSDLVTLPADWPAFAKNDEVLIHVTHDGVTQWRRFTGKVSGLKKTSGGTVVTCAGRIRAYDTFPAGSTNAFVPITPEDDAARAERLADGADPALVIEGDPGRWVRQIPTNNPSSPLLDQLIRLTEDCQSKLVEDRLGSVHYRTRNFTLPSRLTLVSGAIDHDALEESSEDDVVNAVDVYYGEPRVSDGIQRHSHAEDAASIIAIGERREELSTDLQWGNGATGLAEQYLAERNGQAYIPDVPIIMSALTEGQADDVLDLQEGWPVRVTPLPAAFEADTYDGDILGFTDIMHREDYRIILHLAPSLTPDEETPETPVYPDGILTGYDDAGTWTDEDDREYRWVSFTTPGESWLNVDHDEAVLCDVVQVGAGGGGGYPTGSFSNYAGGGAAGGFPGLQRFLINPGEWPVEIGAGGAKGDPAQPGGDTVFYGARIYGGGKGGSASDSDGGDGASGGGSSNAFGGLIGTPGTGIDGMGHDGYRGGGGAGTVAPGGSDGGDGLEATIADDTVEYGKGGPSGGSWTSRPNTGQGGRGGSPVDLATDGDAGVLILQYRIA
jgi:hypothetical protein